MKMNTIKRHGIIALSLKIFLFCLNFLKMMYFSHTIGPTILGSFFIFLSLFYMIALAGDGGLRNATAKKISEGEDKNEFFSIHLIIHSIFMVTVIGILFLYRDLFKNLITPQ